MSSGQDVRALQTAVLSLVDRASREPRVSVTVAAQCYVWHAPMNDATAKGKLSPKLVGIMTDYPCLPQIKASSRRSIAESFEFKSCCWYTVQSISV